MILHDFLKTRMNICGPQDYPRVRAVEHILTEVFKVIKDNMHPEVLSYYWKGKEVVEEIESSEKRLSTIKKALLDKAWLMHVFQTSKTVYTGSLRDVIETGKTPELDYLIERDNEKKERKWFPEIVDFIGKSEFN